MSYDKTYYPLTGTRGTYKQPETVYMSIETSIEGHFEIASIIDYSGKTIIFDDIEKIAAYLNLLKSGTWVLTYNIDFIGAVFENWVNRFSFEGYGEDTLTLTLSRDKWKIYIIDEFQFFACSIVDVCEKIGFNTDILKSSRKHVKDYSVYRSATIKIIWELFRDEVKETFGVHPSKSPGATALKTFRTTFQGALFAKGKPIKGFMSSGITAAALHWKTGFYPHSYLYDINAAYPHVMRAIPYPTRLTAFANRLPKTNRWIALCEINYKSRLNFSPLILRLEDGSLVHPQEATGARVVLSYIDELTLRSMGDLEIISFQEGVYWYPTEEVFIFREWVERVEKRVTDHPGAKVLWKVTSRSLHSKFAQKPGAPMVEIKIVTPGEIVKLSAQIHELYPLSNGKIAAKILTRKPPQFQAYIMPEFELLTQAAGRLMLYGSVDENTIYADTDSIISTVPRDDINIGSGFGFWKVAGTGPVHIGGPRLYSMNGKIKAAGIRPQDRQELSEAIKKTIAGIETELKAVENPKLLKPLERKITRQHTVKQIKYPHVKISGATAYVTRSPTIEKPIKPVKRYFSKDINSFANSLQIYKLYDILKSEIDDQEASD